MIIDRVQLRRGGQPRSVAGKNTVLVGFALGRVSQRAVKRIVNAVDRIRRLRVKPGQIDLLPDAEEIIIVARQRHIAVEKQNAKSKGHRDRFIFRRGFSRRRASRNDGNGKRVLTLDGLPLAGDSERYGSAGN
ncbi:hypothetical protein SDC9_183120 [bioreactor metagenome]|uniref:Uncharacterized protein n=1 Tax=bioreactor metagenome TaxID=1076179 RepID=A0A645HB78_9ZZZZ